MLCIQMIKVQTVAERIWQTEWAAATLKEINDKTLCKQDYIPISICTHCVFVFFPVIFNKNSVDCQWIWGNPLVKVTAKLMQCS